MDLRSRQTRKENILNHKKKKKEYYLRKKLKEKVSLGESSKLEFDYEKELQDDIFAQTIKEIAKKQKSHIDSRKDKIIEKLVAYKEQKQKYYEENKEKRLQYDKEYRDKKREELKKYRKEYYEKNKDDILKKQKEKRKINKES